MNKLISIAFYAVLITVALISFQNEAVSETSTNTFLEQDQLKIFESSDGKYIINKAPELKGWSEEFTIEKFENLDWVNKIEFKDGEMYVYFIADYTDNKIRKFAADYLDLY